MRISREFFRRDTRTVARELLGQRLVRRHADGSISVGIVVETEAYCGYQDAACHSYKGKTERTTVMFGEKGFAYVYLIYGMYNCLNVTSGLPGAPEAVLIRALEPIEGLSAMETRRGQSKIQSLCSGPGKLCMAMEIDREYNGLDLVTGETLYFEKGAPPGDITASKRINIDYAGEAADYLWRFSVTGNGFVSVKPKTVKSF